MMPDLPLLRVAAEQEIEIERIKNMSVEELLGETNPHAAVVEEMLARRDGISLQEHRRREAEKERRRRLEALENAVSS